MSDYYKQKYYVFKRDDNYISMPYFSVEIALIDNLSYFDFLLQQNFNFYDVDFHRYPEPIFAKNPDEAVKEAKEIEGREINKLRAEISKLKSDKEFCFREGDEYKVFNVETGTPKSEIEKIYKNFSNIFHPDKIKTASPYIMVIINQAWDIIKRRG